MFGKNQVAKVEHGDGTTLDVHSLWSTVQGEGPFAGIPAVFLRLAKCNLRCVFCDTAFDSHQPPRRVTDLAKEIHSRAGEMRSPLVVITGGEPLRQNIGPLCERLAFSGHHMQIETAGTVWCEGLRRPMDSVEAVELRPGVSVVCSPKTGKVHLTIKQWAGWWKYIVRMGEIDPRDGLPMISTQAPQTHLILARPPPNTMRHNIFVQPCTEYRDTKHFLVDTAATQENIKFCAQLAMRFGYRVSLQVHRILGVD